MNPGLLIFTQIAIAGCGFLIYFLYALWRESRGAGKRPKVEIRRDSTHATRGHVLQLHRLEEGAKPRARAKGTR
jgi:threonine/homoserine/homoserine lactone efflux protein